MLRWDLLQLCEVLGEGACFQLRQHLLQLYEELGEGDSPYLEKGDSRRWLCHSSRVGGTPGRSRAGCGLYLFNPPVVLLLFPSAQSLPCAL